jgi:hypothetical protein
MKKKYFKLEEVSLPFDDPGLNDANLFLFLRVRYGNLHGIKRTRQLFEHTKCVIIKFALLGAASYIYVAFHTFM